jgi:hypothetical protein
MTTYKSVHSGVIAVYGCKHGDDFSVLCRTCEELAQLRANDPQPCLWCGIPNNEHSHLYHNQMDKERGLGHSVKLCEGPLGKNWGDLSQWPSLKFRCVVTKAPVNSCDEDFMKDIST